MTHGSKEQNCAQYSPCPQDCKGPKGPPTGWLGTFWTKPHGTPWQSAASAQILCSSPYMCLPTSGGLSATWTTQPPTSGISLTSQMAQLGLALNREPPTINPAQSKLSAALFSYRPRPCSPYHPPFLLSASGERPSPSKKGSEWGHTEFLERCPARPTWTWNKFLGLKPQFQTLLVSALGELQNLYKPGPCQSGTQGQQ